MLTPIVSIPISIITYSFKSNHTALFNYYKRQDAQYLDGGFSVILVTTLRKLGPGFNHVLAT